MTIAEKIIRAKEDYDAVYNTAREEGYNHGYDDGNTDGYNRGYDTGYENGKAAGGYNEGFDAGKQAEHDAFWDAYQGATRRRWASAFLDAGWNDITFYPKHDLLISGDASALFRYSGITDLEDRLNECGVTLDTSECTNLNCAFGESTTITAIPTLDLKKCTVSSATNGMFAGCTSLTTIRKLIVSEETQFINTFQNCPLLENIAFEGVIGQNIDFAYCKELTRASIESIINHLSDAASGKTLTLSKTATEKAFPDWNDWGALVMAHQNWTLSLV